jgi:hypothetical protein
VKSTLNGLVSIFVQLMFFFCLTFYLTPVFTMSTRREFLQHAALLGAAATLPTSFILGQENATKTSNPLFKVPNEPDHQSETDAAKNYDS